MAFTSKPGPAYERSGPATDVLNLISSLSSLPQADPNRIGMWGHSMGGGVTMRAIIVDERVKAAVLYAPISANEEDFLLRYPNPYRHDAQFYKEVSPIYFFEGD